MSSEQFKSHGVFKINEAWATSVQFEAHVSNDKVEKVTLKFMNARKQVLAAKDLSREEALSILGKENVERIEELARETPTKGEELFKGTLSGEKLTYNDGHTADYGANVITRGIDREQDDQDASARQRQALLSQRQNIDLEQNETAAVIEALDGDEAKAKPQNAEPDKATIVPERVASRFLRVENTFYFPDETPAFIDGKDSLKARAMHHEVVAALVAIAEARDWEGLTVRGTEEFRKAVWQAASIRGLEVAGYNPTDLDKAQLASQLAKRGGDKSKAATVENEIHKGIDHEAVQTPPSAAPVRALRRHSGKLLEHGAANYEFNPEEKMNYFVRLEDDKGEQHTVWGVDLERAMREAGPRLGETVSLEFLGKQPVTVEVKDRDPVTGKVVGSHGEIKHRNQWNVERAEAFRKQSPKEVVEKHPDLAPAYGAVAAAKAFAKQATKLDGKPLSTDEQQQFVATTKETVARKIQSGEKLPKPLIRSQEQEQSRANGKARQGEPEAEKSR